MLLAGTGLSYYVNRAMGVRYGTDSPLATATITFNDPSLDTATYTDDLKALAGTGEVRLVGRFAGWRDGQLHFELGGYEPRRNKMVSKPERSLR